MAFPFAVGSSSNTLNGHGFPALKYQGASFSIESVDSSNTGRNQKGKMIRDMVAEKIKWQLEFAPCSSAQLSNLLSIIGTTSHQSFTFYYPDPRTGNQNHGTFYVGARSAPVWTIPKGSSSVALWGNLTMDFIEM